MNRINGEISSEITASLKIQYTACYLTINVRIVFSNPIIQTRARNFAYLPEFGNIVGLRWQFRFWKIWDNFFGKISYYTLLHGWDEKQIVIPVTVESLI